MTDPSIVPGTMRCAKCNFILIRNTIYMKSGTIGAGDNKTEPCPNGCGPLWPMTWQQQAADLEERCTEQMNRARDAEAENERLRGMISTPTTNDWFEGVRLEAAYQQERWGSSDDAGKTPFDWFWLVGYLAQKAASSAVAGNRDKAMHHTISTAAALLNWHRNISGESTGMRPGTQGLAQIDGAANG